MGENKENNPIDESAFAGILKTVQLFLSSNNLEETSKCLLKEIEVKFQNSKIKNASPKGLVLKPDNPTKKDSDVIISVSEKLNVNKSDKKKCPVTCNASKFGNNNSEQEDLECLSEVIRKLKQEKYKTDENNSEFRTTTFSEDGKHVGTLITHRVTEIVHLRHGYSCSCIQQPAESDDKKSDKSLLGKSKDKSKEAIKQCQSKGSTLKDDENIAKKDNETIKSTTPHESLSPQVQEEQTKPDEASAMLLDESKPRKKTKERRISPCPLHIKPQKRKHSASKENGAVIPVEAKNTSQQNSKENSIVENSISSKNQVKSPQKSFSSFKAVSLVSAPQKPEENKEVVESTPSQLKPQSPQKSCTSYKTNSVACSKKSGENENVGDSVSTQVNLQSPQKSVSSKEASVSFSNKESESSKSSPAKSPKSSISSKEVAPVLMDSQEIKDASDKNVSQKKSHSKQTSIPSVNPDNPSVTVDQSSKSGSSQVKSQSPQKSIVSSKEVPPVLVDNQNMKDYGNKNISEMSYSTQKSLLSYNPDDPSVAVDIQDLDTPNAFVKIVSQKSKETTDPSIQSPRKSLISHIEIASVVVAIDIDPNNPENAQPKEIASSPQKSSKSGKVKGKTCCGKKNKEKTSNASNSTNVTHQVTKDSPQKSFVTNVEHVNEVNNVEKVSNKSNLTSVNSPVKSQSPQKILVISPDVASVSVNDPTNKSIVSKEDNVSKHSIVAAHGRIIKELSGATEIKSDQKSNSKEPTTTTSITSPERASLKDPDKVIIRAAEKLEKSKTQEIPSVSATSSTVTTDIIKQKEEEKKKNKRRSLSCYSKPTIDSNYSLRDKDKRKSKSETQTEKIPEKQYATDDTSEYVHSTKESQTTNKTSRPTSTEEFDMTTGIRNSSIQTSFVVKVSSQQYLSDKANMTMIDDTIPNKDIPVGSTPLDYDLIKEDLLNASSDKKLLLLQALRWRITKTDTKTRERNIDAFIRYDVLGLEHIPISSEQTILNGYFCSENTPNAFQEDMARFLNALASLRKGRTYLKNDIDFIIYTLVPILKDEKEGIEIFDLTREYILAIIQKLSIDKEIRQALISQGVLEWLIEYILSKHAVMSNYEADYSTALLTNLCLEDEARERCVGMKEKVVDMIFVLVETPHECCLQYLNNILYCLLTKYYINKLAMNRCLTCKLIDLHSKLKDPSKQKQLQDVIAIHTSVANEDVEFKKSEYREIVYTDQIEVEIEMNDAVTQKPNGEDLLQPYMLTGEKLKIALKIMEENYANAKKKDMDAKKKKLVTAAPGQEYVSTSYNNQTNKACTGLSTCRCKYCCYYTYLPQYMCYKEEKVNSYACECYDTIQDCSEQPCSSGAQSSMFNNYCGYYSYYPYCP